jgi:hypothetical protein
VHKLSEFVAGQTAAAGSEREQMTLDITSQNERALSGLAVWEGTRTQQCLDRRQAKAAISGGVLRRKGKRFDRGTHGSHRSKSWMRAEQKRKKARAAHRCTDRTFSSHFLSAEP